ncbi:hypothetical protein PENTCL1PPCAC_23014, partial [Pristionchus entomophagus]
CLSSLLLLLLLHLVISHEGHDHYEEETELKICGEHRVTLTRTSKRRYAIESVGCWIHITRNSLDDEYVMKEPRVRAVSETEKKKMKPVDSPALCEVTENTNNIYYTCIKKGCEITTIHAILAVCEKQYLDDILFLCLVTFGICACISFPCLFCWACGQYRNIEEDRKRRLTKDTHHTKKLDTTFASSGETLASNPKSVMSAK